MKAALTVWLVFAAVGALLSLPVVVLARRRVHWYSWELLAFVLPFWTLFGLDYLGILPSSDKGIGNAFVEPIMVALTIPVAAIVRATGGKGDKEGEKVFAAVLLAALCLVAAIIFVVTPNLGGNLG
jgi:hypothetical protein